MSWNFDSDRDYPVNYVLTHYQKSWITNQDAGKRSEGQRRELIEKIDDAAAKLPLRFSDLITDLHLLHRFNSLETADFSDSQKHIPKNRSELAELYYAMFSQTGPGDTFYIKEEHPNYGPTRFGLELGNALRLLFEARDCEDEYQTVLWGFILSELANSSTDAEEQMNHLESLLTRFREQFENNGPAYVGVEQASKKEDKWISEYEWEAKKLLTNNRIEPNSEKVSTLLEEVYFDNPGWPDVARLEETFGEYKTQFLLFDFIESIVDRDMELIQENSVRGVSVDKLLKPLIDGIDLNTINPAINTNTLAKESDKPQGKVTEALRFLYNEYDKSHWPHYRITEETAKGWELTGYGRLVSYRAFESDNYRWLYEYLFDNIDYRQSHIHNEYIVSDAVYQILNQESDESRDVKMDGGLEATISDFSDIVEELHSKEP